MNTSLNDLRSHLFEVIERLKEGNDPDADPKDAIDIERAKVIADVAKEVISSAKVEVEALKVMGSTVNFDIQKEFYQTGLLPHKEKEDAGTT